MPIRGGVRCLMANAILNFHFDYWNPSLTNNQRAEDPAWRNRGGTCQPWGIIGSFDIELTFTGGRLCRSIFRPGRCKTTSELNICVPGLKKGKTEEKLFLFWQAVVSTMCQPQYESSVADADILISAKVIKVTNHLYLYLAVWCTYYLQAKFKLEDVVRETLCLEEVPRKQCMDINVQVRKLTAKTTFWLCAALIPILWRRSRPRLNLPQMKLGKGNCTTVQYSYNNQLCTKFTVFETFMPLFTTLTTRFEAIGTKLTFSDDNDPGWGPG